MATSLYEPQSIEPLEGCETFFSANDISAFHNFSRACLAYVYNTVYKYVPLVRGHTSVVLVVVVSGLPVDPTEYLANVVS
jgi:hypothetical protein